MIYPIEQYEKQAATAFSNLLKTFKGWGNGWQVGNVFDTLTDYVRRYPKAEPTPGAVVAAARERWANSGLQGSMCWYDDWGWWGIASVKAYYYDYRDIFGTYWLEFQDLANSCWNVMYAGKPDKKTYKYKGGPNVWDNRDDGSMPGYFTSSAGWAVPRFPGGVWQYDMFHDTRPEPPECAPGSSNPSDPKKCRLGPFQNTVMNGLYFVLAVRLVLESTGSGAPDAIKNELVFLNTWFKQAGDESLLQSFSDGSMLVRERVATYASADGGKTFPAVEGYTAKGQWGGDQGLILGGLLDYLQLVPSAPLVQSQAVAIARGVLLHMTDANGIMKPFSDGFDDQGDYDDYSCGSGVFWRYLLRGFNHNTALRKEMLDLIAKHPETNPIYKSAENPYAYAPANHELFKEFNALSVLLTAIEILKHANV